MAHTPGFHDYKCAGPELTHQNTRVVSRTHAHMHTHALTEAMAAHAELMAFTFLISALCDLRVKAYDQIES